MELARHLQPAPALPERREGCACYLAQLVKGQGHWEAPRGNSACAGALELGSLHRAGRRAAMTATRAAVCLLAALICVTGAEAGAHCFHGPPHRS